jgi:Na+/H+ antiporter NhaC
VNLNSFSNTCVVSFSSRGLMAAAAAAAAAAAGVGRMEVGGGG